MDYGTNRLHLVDHWDNYGLSFVLPANSETMIVHGGGYNEPVVANIPMDPYIDAADSNLFESVCASFHQAADEFIEFVDALCRINVDTVVALWAERNLDLIPESLDNVDKFEIYVAPSELVGLAEAHKRALGGNKNYA